MLICLQSLLSIGERSWQIINCLPFLIIKVDWTQIPVLLDDAFTKMTGFLLPKTKIILVIVKLMNILDAEEMAEAQGLLLQTPTHPPYTFLPPESSLVSTLQTFSSSFLSLPSRQIQEQTLRIVSSAHNMRAIKKEDPNASIKAFSYSVLGMIFPGGDSNQCQKGQANELLLETLKCSLYSKDLNFNLIRNKNLKVDNLQAKAIMAKFFSALISLGSCSNAHKIRYIEWSFQRNQVLEELFILFYRIILAKLQVEGADDYSRPLGFPETITNLIEYFDINYRNFGEFFLIPEENQFLASVSGYFVLGQYMENEGYVPKETPNNTKGAATLEVPPHSSSKHQEHKKNGVFQKDIKLFNFILESGRESHHMNDKDGDMETPHFKDSHEFAFGRKRKDQEQTARQQELKKEFEKFFMSSQAESVQEGQPEHIPSRPILPAYRELIGVPLKESEQLQTRPRNHTDQSDQLPLNNPPFLKKSTFNQSLIHELEDEVIDQPKINPQTHHKNMVSVKDKNLTSFSPQISDHLRYQGFSSFVNDTIFLDQQANPDLFKSSSGENVQNPFSHYNGCSCIENRRKRNKIMSKVVDFLYYQAKTQRPKFLQNLKYSQNIPTNSPKVRPLPKDSLNLRQDTTNKEFRKPAFLKFLKKDKQACDQSISSRSKSKSKSRKQLKQAGPPLYKDKSCFQLDKDTMSRINDKCTAFSTIISKSQLDLKSKFHAPKSATKRNESSSLTKRSPVKQSTIKNFDSKYLNERPGLGSTRRLNDHFHYQPTNIEKQKASHSGMIQTSRNQNVRVYAPVNIIAPTVYFNGITERDNRVIFTVNNTGERQQELGLKMSERRLRTETGYTATHPNMGFMVTPHQRFI